MNNKSENIIENNNKVLRSQSCSDLPEGTTTNDKRAYFIRVPSASTLPKQNSSPKMEILRRLSKSSIEREEILKQIETVKKERIGDEFNPYIN